MKAGKKSSGWVMIKTINDVTDSHDKSRKQSVLCKIFSSYNISDVGNHNGEQKTFEWTFKANSLSS